MCYLSFLMAKYDVFIHTLAIREDSANIYKGPCEIIAIASDHVEDIGSGKGACKARQTRFLASSHRSHGH